MEETFAIKMLAALAQAHRMKVFRLLVRAGPNGVTAGDIATALGVPPSSLSFHLSQLEHAELVRSWRVQRHIFYAVEFTAMRGLLSFLLADCCQGAPDACAPLLDLALPGQIPADQEGTSNETSAR